MALDRATVERIAALARIEIAGEEADALAAELGAILGWVETLNEVDTADVAPMTSVGGHSLPWRRDVVDDGGYPGRILTNAPDTAGAFFAVPKVVE
ncbi:MAG: Asp-tRNA(Asn)/Glu-tRNA(Gln) amidotransferase subunit GatC [Alphaproteobacteria bacterium]|nr:Asp-tRNA(Asn)/Glu-tRNA(Gln) amidotransferase subunit GatC [Alphaproteobacteria bacterium]